MCFAGNPPHDATETKRLMQGLLHPQPEFDTQPPTSSTFFRAMHQPKDKAAGPEGFSPHLLSHLPKDLQWGLYQAVIPTWMMEVVHHYL